jgi:putative hydrolase of the HAD superfamily
MSIRAIVFDFGNVVAFFSHRRAAEQLAAYTDLPAEAIFASVFGGQLEDDYEAGRITTAEFMGLVRETCRLHCTDAQFAAAYADIFTANPDTCALIPRLKSRYRLLLLSNTSELHADQFRRQFAATLGLFDHLVLSYEIGLRKPDPKLYDHCRRLAARAASECLFLDDLPANVEGARARGWQGLVYRRGDDLMRALAECGVSLGG